MQKSVSIKPRRWRLYMRIGVLQWIISALMATVAYATDGSAQSILNREVSVRVSNVTLKNALEQIQKETQIKFVYSSKVSLQDRVSLNVADARLAKVLDDLLRPHGIDYSVVNQQIILSNAKTTKPETTAPAPAKEPQALAAPEDILIKGTVLAQDDQSALPGVSVVLRGTSSGTTTDQNGEYEIRVPNAESVLVFSFVGYISQEVTVGNRTRIDLSLQVDNKMLEEVVVVGYGTQKRVNLTGAVTQVQARELENRPLNNMTQILQGMVPNLNITFGTGQPGAGGSLNVRGETSINGGSPLVLIDGVPGDINRINPNDVESVSVLKDAAASAIYGARGAFGVILVTTKTAKSGKTSINYSNNFGWGTPTVSTDFMTTGYDQVMLNDEAFKRATGNTYTRYSEEDYKELEARRFDSTLR